MKLEIESTRDDILPSDLYEKIIKDVSKSLTGIVANSDTEFIVNPTIWYNINRTRKGTLDAKQKVINSAEFLSKGIGRNLTELGWFSGSNEKTISDQRIDGYIELDHSEELYCIEESRFLEFMLYIQKKAPQFIIQGDLKKTFLFFYNFYCKSSWFSPDVLGIEDKSFFTKADYRKIKVGLEFETGNIASSFRALHKLDYLFSLGQLDFGVFITSKDKAGTSAKIWPSSNRNGSFEELNNRNYKDNYIIPRLDIAFSPDRYSSDVNYLGHDGSLFNLEYDGEEVDIKGVTYIKYVYNNIDYWMPKIS